MRDWVEAARRSLAVDLPLVLEVPTMPEPSGEAIIVLRGVGATVGDRTLFAGLDQCYERSAVTNEVPGVSLGLRTKCQAFRWATG